MRTHKRLARASGAILHSLFALFLFPQICMAQSVLPTEEAAIKQIIGRLSEATGDVRDDVIALANDFVASKRFSAAEALYKRIIAEVDKPDKYLENFQPPMWVKPLRSSFEIWTATYFAFPELVRLLVDQGRTEEALEYADMIKAKILRAVMERRTLGGLPFQKFSPMPTSHMRALAKETQSTFIVYLMLPQRAGSNTKGSAKRQFDIFAWVIQPSGSISFEAVPIEADIVPGETDDGDPFENDPIRLVANSFTRSVKRGMIDRLERSTQAEQQQSTQTEQRIVDPSEGMRALEKLHDVLISRLEKFLPVNPDDKVVIVPDGSLYLVPFAALPNSSGSALIERHTLSIVPSIAIYELLRRKAKQKIVWSRAKSALVVGNPKMPSWPVASGLEGSLLPLAGADQEADAVASLFRTKALKGQYALEDEVIARMPGADLIHFATHGLLISTDFVTTGNHSGSVAEDLPPGVIVLADNPRKRVKIAEGDYTKTPINGFLSSGKILKLKLQAELVTLSACDTARGRTVDHDFAALPSALMAAGARSVVMTLWAIPDAPTAQMMTVFYEQLLAGRSKAAALRHAMLATKQLHTNVENWGAFTLIGWPD